MTWPGSQKNYCWSRWVQLTETWEKIVRLVCWKSQLATQRLKSTTEYGLLISQQQTADCTCDRPGVSTEEQPSDSGGELMETAMKSTSFRHTPLFMWQVSLNKKKTQRHRSVVVWLNIRDLFWMGRGRDGSIWAASCKKGATAIHPKLDNKSFKIWVHYKICCSFTHKKNWKLSKFNFWKIFCKRSFVWHFQDLIWQKKKKKKKKKKNAGLLLLWGGQRILMLVQLDGCNLVKNILNNLHPVTCCATKPK